jgi:hypothetical protein
LTVSVYCQNQIDFSYSQPVTDSLLKGVEYYERMYKKPARDLKLYALVELLDSGVGIYLSEYSNLKESGLGKLIGITNRYLQLSASLSVPIIFPADINSLLVRKDKISLIPYAGYYVEVEMKNYQEVVKLVAKLF